MAAHQQTGQMAQAETIDTQSALHDEPIQVEEVETNLFGKLKVYIVKAWHKIEQAIEEYFDAIV